VTICLLSGKIIRYQAQGSRPDDRWRERERQVTLADFARIAPETSEPNRITCNCWCGSSLILAVCGPIGMAQTLLIHNTIAVDWAAAPRSEGSEEGGPGTRLFVLDVVRQAGATSGKKAQAAHSQSGR
jgi:hypothetical protein